MRQVLQRAHAFCKTLAAVDCAKVNKLIANARVRADALPHQFNIGTDGLGNIRDFIDEAYLGRQHGIGCVLGQLRTTRIHEH